MKQINRIYNCPTYKKSGKNQKFRDIDLEIIFFTDEGNLLNNIPAFHHARTNCKFEAETGACKSDPVYMSSISCSKFCAGIGLCYF